MKNLLLLSMVLVSTISVTSMAKASTMSRDALDIANMAGNSTVAKALAQARQLGFVEQITQDNRNKYSFDIGVDSGGFLCGHVTLEVTVKETRSGFGIFTTYSTKFNNIAVTEDCKNYVDTVVRSE